MKTSSETKSKLTLSVSKSNLENARKFAEQHGTSLSFLVDSYLSNFQPKAQKTKPPYSINEMFGFLKDSPMSNMTDREIRDMMIKDKYGL
ncbi:hypothetical protein SAMN05216327_10561 [Dyadobacter sp. SG02]|uniref:DUF6364 family protein n=1 Tax=Dyadobacter sp. SG02 TaxID=1855291 RepID=UPI0008BD1656|nr:DUF6364 family protein [Dyadobacter sp. SG02]SEI97457.1 hypothetical protein SAMN05216327_10561 [Dyadobacter sp. SG02]